MVIRSEQDMIAFGEKFAKDLTPPATIELIGDIGVGKTTLVKGIAKGLGIAATVTSPSFMIFKTYYSQHRFLTLAHFDFYRLKDPGIMREELNEAVNQPNTITIIEWSSTVKNTIPKNRIEITICYNNDNSRKVTVSRL